MEILFLRVGWKGESRGNEMALEGSGGNRAGWCVPVVLALWKQRQGDCELKAGLSITARHCLNMITMMMMMMVRTVIVMMVKVMKRMVMVMIPKDSREKRAPSVCKHWI